MKLEEPSRRKMPVHELAKALRWTSQQLLEELRRRGEYVSSPNSTLEAPVVRDILRQHAPATPEPDPETTLDPHLYGTSAAPEHSFDDVGNEPFAAALARIKAQPRYRPDTPKKATAPRPAILQALLDEVIAKRADHLDGPRGGGHYRWELERATKLNRHWSEARLTGLGGDDATVLSWIRLSHGTQPQIAAELSQMGISPQEADLHLGYGGRTDTRMPNIYDRFRRRTINRAEAITAVRAWRQRHLAS